MSDSKPFMFTFNAALAVEAEQVVEQQLTAIEERIDKLVRAATIQGIPVAGHILHLSKNAEELETCGKVLQRLAEIMPAYESLLQKRDTLKLAQAEPEWMAFAFGEFMSEIEAATTKLERGDLDDFS